MASLAVPLFAEALPLITPILTNLIGHVMNSLGPNHPALHSTVVQSVSPILKQLATDGKIPTNINPDVLSAVIETLINQMAPSVVPNIPIASPMPEVISGTDVSNGDAAPVSSTTSAPFILPPGTKIIFSGTLTLQ